MPPVRGLVSGRCARDGVIGLTTLRRWLHHSADRFHVEKADLWEPGAASDRILPLLEEAELAGLRLSIIVDPSADPGPLGDFAAAGLFDVVLCPQSPDLAGLLRWRDACASNGVAFRAHLPGRLLDAPWAAELPSVLQDASVLTVYFGGGFAPGLSAGPRVASQALDAASALLRALANGGPELHLADAPFCRVPENLWPYISNTPQRLAHHQHYHAGALEFARRLISLSPRRAGQAVEIAISEGASFHNAIDRAVLPWILERNAALFRVWFLHKLTRWIVIRRPRPEPLPEDTGAIEARLAEHRAAQARMLGPTCAACRMRLICDGPSEVFKQAFPGAAISAIPGGAITDPLAFRAKAPAWYDAVDSARRLLPAYRRALVEHALRTLRQTPPDREIPAESYAIEGHFTDRMPASVRWFSFSTGELVSTPLARVSPPFTLSATFGGGIAERIGFAFGRHARIMCPMIAPGHTLALHVDGAGRYVLLRDDIPVAPSGFRDTDRVPERIGSVAEPRLAVVNLDGQIVTQTVLVWEGATVAERAPARHSVVIVCTRFARRLQAALLCLAHQEGLAPGALEVIVGYVPGIDATDDVLDSLEARYPALAVRRVPFTADRARAKGFLINECASLARGAWITLLDADILLPPDYFTRLDALPEATVFAAPEGRYMLDAETTAGVLLGDIAPRDRYTTLQEAAPEFRRRESEGYPPGFCQSFRRRIFDEIRYAELDHFEGSDWLFSKSVVDRYGPETRLAGLGVLHLDHGGSQWYGTGKQR